MKAAGHFFKELSSKEEAGEINIKKQTASIKSGELLICENVKIKSIQGRRDIYLSNGFLFTLLEPLTAEQENNYLNKHEKIINWLEVFSFRKAVILSSVLLVGIIFIRLALYSSIHFLVAVFPSNWEEKIGSNAYTTLAKVAFEKTELPPKKISTLLDKASEMASANGLKNSNIYFHKSNLFGANALAFPGGPIVVTDDLVKLLDQDDLILAVIAHEFAHIEQRHSLHQIMEVVGIAALASVLFGSTDNLIEDASVVAVDLWASKKSRHFEKEADFVALDYLEAVNLNRTSFTFAIEKLMQHMCNATTEKSFDTCLKNDKSGWFSTHPSGAERLKYLTLENDI